jgi:hypothetical protein
MRPRAPRPWFLIVSVTIVLCAGTWIASGHPNEGGFAFVAWDMLITWLVCLGIAIYTYWKKWATYRSHQVTSSAEEKPAP